MEAIRTFLDISYIRKPFRAEYLFDPRYGHKYRFWPETGNFRAR
jgi:hypothetical protein